MSDLLKIYLVLTLRTIVFKAQLGIRFLLNGRCYPTKKQRENGSFKDYWIGWLAYKHFSKVSVCNNWLEVYFPTPSNDFIFTTNKHGDKMTKTFKEVVEVININNK